MKYTRLWWLVLTSLTLAAAVILAPRPVHTGAEHHRHILIIDPGHGGADGGASAADGTLECDLNLDIALRLDALASFWGVDTVMTRRSSQIDYPAEAQTLSAKKKADQHARAALIDSISDGVLLSIHQNNYPSSSPSGIQIFYGGEAQSASFAALMQDNFISRICPENRRVAAPIDDSIYLMRTARCPSVLVECGFLSNPRELEMLKNASYRTKLAVVMLASYMEFTEGNQL